MATMIDKKCKYCKATISVRLADHKRGWGNFCNKSCKAAHQTKLTGIDGPHYKAEGMTVNQMRNGKYAKSKFRGRKRKHLEGKFCRTCGSRATVAYQTNFINEDQDYGFDDYCPDGIEYYCDRHGDDTHPFSSEALGQW